MSGPHLYTTPPLPSKNYFFIFFIFFFEHAGEAAKKFLEIFQSQNKRGCGEMIIACLVSLDAPSCNVVWRNSKVQRL
jgi:hypothetical protein